MKSMTTKARLNEHFLITVIIYGKEISIRKVIKIFINIEPLWSSEFILI